MKKAAIIFGKILLGILVFVLCLALTVSTIVTVLMADVRILTDKDNINTLITGYLTASAPRQTAGLPLADGAVQAPPSRLNTPDVSSMGDGNFLVDYIYDMMQQEAGGQMPVSKAQIESFVEESTLDDFLAEKGASLVSDFLTGEDTTTITAEEIEEKLNENLDLINQTFGEVLGQPLTTEVISELTVGIEQSGVLSRLEEGGLEGILDMGGNQETSPEEKAEEVDLSLMALLSGKTDISKLSVPQLVELFRNAISVNTLLLCIGVCAVLIGLIFLCRWKKYYSAMVIVGVTLLVTGLLCIIPAVVVWSVPDMLAPMLQEARVPVTLVNTVVGMTCPVTIGILVLALALVVSGAVLGNMAKKRARAEAFTAATEEISEEGEAAEAPAEEVAPEKTAEVAAEAE